MRGWGTVVPCAAWLLSASTAWADHKVYSPIVEEGVVEFETRSHRTFDSSRDKDGAEEHKFELGVGLTSWWHTALLGKVEKEPEGNARFEAGAWENIFQLTPQGKYWLDAGIYTEYTRSLRGREAPGELEFKLLLEKEIRPLVVTTNLIFNREIGRNSGKGIGFEYAARVNYPWRPEIQFGIEAFGEPGRFTGFKRLSEQEHEIGPVMLGKFHVPGVRGVFGYNVGYLFGLTPETPQGTVKVELELEIPFY
jgi:hypothetical protein